MRNEHDRFKYELYEVKERHKKEKTLLSSRREKMRMEQSLINENTIRE